MKDTCIVNVASLGRENYNKAQLNLIASCVESGWAGNYLMRSVDGYCNEYKGVPITLGKWPITKQYGVSWQHIDMPYQFKPFAIQEAREAGYTKIIWADSTCRMLANPEPFFDYANKYGVCVFNNLGYPLKDWITDAAQKKIGLSDEKLQTAKQIMACFIIWDFNVPMADVYFQEWITASLDNVCFNNNYGSSRPGFKETRHDQSALSAILSKYDVPIKDYGNGFCYYPHNETKEFGNGKYYFINKGVE